MRMRFSFVCKFFVRPGHITRRLLDPINCLARKDGEIPLNAFNKRISRLFLQFPFRAEGQARKF